MFLTLSNIKINCAQYEFMSILIGALRVNIVITRSVKQVLECQVWPHIGNLRSKLFQTFQSSGRATM